MRSTAPTLRRRNLGSSRYQRRQFRRDGNDLDSDSDADDEADAPFRAALPQIGAGSTVGKASSVSTGSNLGNGLNLGTGSSRGSGLGLGLGLGSSLGSTTGRPESTLAAGEEGEEDDDEDDDDKEEGDDEDSDTSVSGVESETDGDVSDSGEDTDDEEAALLPPPPATTTASTSTIAAPPAFETIAPPPPPVTTSTSSPLPPPPPAATAVLSTSTTRAPLLATTSAVPESPPPVLAPIGEVIEDSTPTTTPVAVATTNTPPGSGGNMSQLEPTLASSSTQDTISQITGVPSSAVPVSPPPPVSSAGEGIGSFAPGQDRVVDGPSDSPQITSNNGGMNTGAAVGIVIGVLAFVGIILVGGWFLMKMRKRGDSLRSWNLPRFTPPKGFNFGSRSSANRSTWAWKFWDGSSSSSSDRSSTVVPPLPPAMLRAENKKTNSEMVDDLMRAAYAAESGENYNDLESRAGGYYDEKAAAPNQNYLDEKAYAALQGGKGPYSPLPPPMPTAAPVQTKKNQGRPLTNGTTRDPMTKWLDATVTPHQSRFGPPPSTAGLAPDQPPSPWPMMPPPPQAGLDGNNYLGRAAGGNPDYYR